MEANRNLKLDSAAQSLYEAVLILVNESENRQFMVKKIKRYIENGDTTGLHGLFIRLPEDDQARKQYALFFSRADKAELKEILYRIDPVYREYTKNHYPEIK